jgi:hypothetical protein
MSTWQAGVRWLAGSFEAVGPYLFAGVNGEKRAIALDSPMGGQVTLGIQPDDDGARAGQLQSSANVQLQPYTAHRPEVGLVPRQPVGTGQEKREGLALEFRTRLASLLSRNRPNARSQRAAWHGTRTRGTLGVVAPT